MIRVTILYDNYTTDPLLEPGWGVLMHHTEGPILFDTGGSGEVLLRNMGVLGIDPASIYAVFISHDHWDHTGGLGAVLTRGDGVLLSRSTSTRRHGREQRYASGRMKSCPACIPRGTLMEFEQSLFIATPKGAVAVTDAHTPGWRRSSPHARALP